MTAPHRDAGLATPREIGETLARDLPAPTLRQFMAALDDVLDGMRQGLCDAGQPLPGALRICREAREAALGTRWRQAAGGGE